MFTYGGLTRPHVCRVRVSITMIGFVALSRSHSLLRLAALALVATGIAGCSGEATRWSDAYIYPYGNPYANPYGNPYASNGAARSDITGSVAPPPPGRVETQPLPQPQAVQSLPPPAAGAQSMTMSANIGSSGGAQGMGSFRPAPAPPAPATPAAYTDVTGGVANAKPTQSKWNWDGGTAIIVGPG